jgi:hypothetical protein
VSGVVERVIAEKIGEPTAEDLSVYEAYDRERQGRPPKEPEGGSSELPKTGPDPDEPARTKRPPSFLQPKLESKKEDSEDDSEEMEGFIPPILLL